MPGCKWHDHDLVGGQSRVCPVKSYAGFSEDLQVWNVRKKPTPLLSGDLLQQPQFHEPRYGVVGGGKPNIGRNCSMVEFNRSK